MVNKYKTNIIKLLKLIISIIIIFYLLKYIKANSNTLSSFQFHFNYYYLIFSFIVLLIYFFNQLIIWHYLTKQNKCNINFSLSITSRAYSEFGKYVPGKVVGYAMLLYVYSKENQSKRLVAISMFYELLTSTLAASLVFLFSLFFTDINEFRKYRIIALSLMILFFIIIHPSILKYLSSFFFKIFKREQQPIDISYSQLLKIIMLYVLNFLIYGIAFMLFINSISPISFSNYIFITGTTIGAGIIGLFAVFVPAGLGVREGVMIFTLSFLITPAFAGIIALTTRIWMIFAEIFLLGLIILCSKIKRKVTKISNNIELPISNPVKQTIHNSHEN